MPWEDLEEALDEVRGGATWERLRVGYEALQGVRRARRRERWRLDGPARHRRRCQDRARWRQRTARRQKRERWWRARPQQLELPDMGARMSRPPSKKYAETGDDRSVRAPALPSLVEALAPPDVAAQCVRGGCTQPRWMGKLCQTHFIRLMPWPASALRALVEREEKEKLNGSSVGSTGSDDGRKP